MKIIKPVLLGFLWRTYKRQGNRLALTGLLAFPFSDPEVPLTEQEMWKSVAPLFPSDSPWDEGIPKDRGEVLLVGDSHAPGGSPVPHRQASLRIGPVAKVLDVYGDRVWNRDRGLLRKSDPQPFLSMPVDFAHAFGGTGYGPNPVGKGFAESPDGGPRPLPNIEDPLRPLSSPDDRPEPAGFGPLGIVWTGRYRKVGRYRSHELGKEPPPLPADADWTLFNQAPPDQWLPGMWNGGEEFSLSGFHPESDIQAGQLPRIRIRAFVAFLEEHTVEAMMRPETVWLFPGLSMGVVVHRGSLPIESDDASEVGSILLGAEDPGETRSVDHYLAVRSRREDKGSKDLSRFGDAPLLPGRLADDPRANLFDPNRLMGQSPQNAFEFPKRVSRQMDKVQEKLDKVRESLSRLPKPPEGSSVDLSGSLRAHMDTADKRFKELRERLENPSPPATADKLEELKKKKIDVDALKQQAVQKFEAAIDRIPPDVLEKMGKTREDLLSKIAGLKGSFQGLPKNPAPRKIQPSVEELIGKDRIVSSLQSVRARVTGSLPEGGPPSSEVSEKLAQMEASLESLPVLLNRMGAAIPRPSVGGIIRILHHFSPPDPDPVSSSELRRTVLEELSRRGSFKNRNLRGVDLSGLDLTGADFSDADLIGSDFTGSNLSDARCDGAWMAHADLSRCTLDRTNFSGASLGCANLSGSGGAGMSFRNAFLSGAILSDVLFSEGDFSGADLFHAVFKRSKIPRSSFVSAKFLRAGALPFSRPEGLPPSEESIPRFPIEETDFAGSDFTKAFFMKVDFIRSNLSGCRLDQANFLECTGPGARFDEASLKKAAFPKSTDFKQSIFSKADLSGANLRGLDLEGSDFRGAVLAGMDGSGGIFRRSNLSGAKAQKARFLKSDLRSADGRGGDFSQSLFLKADLRGADFSHSSLYKAGFTGAKVDAATLWDHALTGKTPLPQERAR